MQGGAGAQGGQLPQRSALGCQCPQPTTARGAGTRQGRHRPSRGRGRQVAAAAVPQGLALQPAPQALAWQRVIGLGRPGSFHVRRLQHHRLCPWVAKGSVRHTTLLAVAQCGSAVDSSGRSASQHAREPGAGGGARLQSQSKTTSGGGSLDWKDRLCRCIHDEGSMLSCCCCCCGQWPPRRQRPILLNSGYFVALYIRWGCYLLIWPRQRANQGPPSVPSPVTVAVGHALSARAQHKSMQFK